MKSQPRKIALKLSRSDFLEDKLIVALDTADKKEALRLVDILYPRVERFKVGSVLFTSSGPDIVKDIARKGGKVFLDLKFHDIPKVVAGAVQMAAGLGVEMLTVHTLGGEEMLKASVEAVKDIKHRPKVFGVTVLTSLEDKSLKKIGIPSLCRGEVKKLARLAESCGLDGIVASARELNLLRRILPSAFLIITPGIRLPEDAAGDQKRIMTPGKAISGGADYIVVGRPVTLAENPQEAVDRIINDISENIREDRGA